MIATLCSLALVAAVAYWFDRRRTAHDLERLRADVAASAARVTAVENVLIAAGRLAKWGELGAEQDSAGV